MIDLQLLEKHIKEHPKSTYRRTVSIDIDNHCFIQLYRGTILKLGRDLKYSPVVNDLLREAIQNRLKRVNEAQQKIGKVEDK